VSRSRTSENSWVERASSPVTERIFRRAAEVLGIDERFIWDKSGGAVRSASGTSVDGSFPQGAESMQLVHYSVGQKYDAHYDWGVSHPETRFATLLLYLKEPLEGGKTAFPKAETPTPLAVPPVAGSAVLFYNVLPDGNCDIDSLHAAMPVTEGEKWLANIWVWDPMRSQEVSG